MVIGRDWPPLAAWRLGARWSAVVAEWGEASNRGLGVGPFGLFARAEGDQGHGIEGELAHELLERARVDGHQGGHVPLERAVLPVVDPLAADRAHAPQRHLAGEDQAAGALVLGALDFRVVQIR